MNSQKNKNLKIVIFVSEFSPLSETFIYNQINVLKEDHDLYVVCLKRINENVRPFEQVEVVNYEESIIQKIKNKVLRSGKIYLSYRNTNFSNQLNQFLRQINPDLIHCHFGPNCILFADNCLSDKIPVIVTFHGYDASYLLQTSSIYKRRIKEILQRKNIYSLFVSNALLTNLKSFGVTPRWSKVLYLGIDTTTFQRKTYQKDRPFVFLQLSRFVEKKGHEFTIKAFHQFLRNKPDFSGQLVLAGDGPLRAEMMALCETLNIQNQVIFSGSVNHEEVKDLLEEARVFLHPSVTSSNGDTEGIPTAIMEAMAMELPVISTYHSGIPELVIDGQHGFLVEERNIGTYSLRMAEVLDWNYKKENRQAVLSKFGNKVYIENLLSVYTNILSHND